MQTLHMAQLMLLPLTVSCFRKIRNGFTFLVPAHPGSPGKRAVKRVCVCVYREQLTSKVLRYGTCELRITQFYLPPTPLSTSGINHTCLYFLPTEPFGKYSFPIPHRAGGWVGLGVTCVASIYLHIAMYQPCTCAQTSTTRMSQYDFQGTNSISLYQHFRLANHNVL